MYDEYAYDARETMSIQVKICGLKDEKTLRAAIDAGADYVGFVFYPKSPRSIMYQTAAKLGTMVPTSIKKVALIVDATDQEISQIMSSLLPDFLQLHGAESEDRIVEIKKTYPNIKIIKAVNVAEQSDLEAAQKFFNCADMMLFDAKHSGQDLPGGNGVPFDWEVLKDFDCPLPWMLAGGLRVENIAQAIKMTRCKIIDVSSGVESAPGEKDIKKIKAFVEAVSLL